MSNIFVRKIQTERKVLKIINGISGNKSQLVGLTNNAIEIWKNQSELENLDAIVSVLNELAGLCGLLSSRSGEGINELTDERTWEIDPLIKKLKSLAIEQGS